MVDLEANLAAVRRRIREAAERAGRDPGGIMLVGITKTFPVETVLAAHALGLDDLGENRVEEALEKVPRVNQELGSGKPIRWHMVGHLQHRKVKDAVALFDVVHSVDSVALAARLDDRAAALGKQLPVLLEVNVSREQSKYGFPFEPREPFFAAVREILELTRLELQGLMTVAPIVTSPEQARPYFGRLRELRDDLRASFPAHAWTHLSMGMTDDFEAAIAEGATLVRIGRAIFGERI